MKIRKRKVSREMLFLEIWVVVTLLSMALGQYVASLVKG
jgi:hypothetical protein